MRNVGIKEVDGKDKADATGGKNCGGEKIAAGIAQPKFGATSPQPPKVSWNPNADICRSA